MKSEGVLCLAVGASFKRRMYSTDPLSVRFHKFYGFVSRIVSRRLQRVLVLTNCLDPLVSYERFGKFFIPSIVVYSQGLSINFIDYIFPIPLSFNILRETSRPSKRKRRDDGKKDRSAGSSKQKPPIRSLFLEKNHMPHISEKIDELDPRNRPGVCTCVRGWPWARRSMSTKFRTKIENENYGSQ